MAYTIREFAHLQIPLEDVRKATNNFDDRNIIGKGGFGNVYKGYLTLSGESIKIAARRLDGKHKQGYIEFWTEISVLSNLKHENLVSIIGFCDEDNEKIIINSYNAKGSLLTHLSKPRLTWIKRLRICVGVARALSYIHNEDEDGRNDSVIHRNINSSTILLDNKFVPRVSGFEYSVKYSIYRKDHVLLSDAFGTTGYMDPAIQETGGVTHKSDIYSFGVVLWEVLCGRKAFIPNEEEGNRYLARLAKLHYENGTMNNIIPPALRNQMALQSLTSFSKAAYSCLKDDRVQRPDMNSILHELENALELQMPYEDLKKNLEHLKIGLNDILLATNNLSKSSVIGFTPFYKLYRAELEQFDKVNLSFVKVKNKCDLPKREKNTVIIKSILSNEDKDILRIRNKHIDGREVFLRELEMLTTCKHRNIVTLLGFCYEGSEMILVIEHLSNGYLDDFLINIKDMPILYWAQRLKICLDVAHGLKYLHYEMEDQRKIINHDLKSQSIALDENWAAKIVDFGQSMFLPPNNDNDAINLPDTYGTPYYMDPEYKKIGRLKRETDVYNFGVVLFEVLCGRIAYDQIYVKESDQGLAHLARVCYSEGRIEEMVDSIIKEEIGINKDSLDKFIKIAYQCVAPTQDERPTMSVVVNELEHALFLQERVQLSNKDEFFDEIHEKPGELKLTHECPRIQLSNKDEFFDEIHEKPGELKLTHECPERIQLSNKDEIFDDIHEKPGELKLTHESPERVQLSNKFEIFDEIHEKPGELKLTHEIPERVQVNQNVDPVIDRVEDTIELKLMHENRANNLEHLKIPLSEIMLATNNFSKEYHTQTTKHYHTYEAEFGHYDKLSRPSIEGKNNDELPKRRNTVCIRRFIHVENRLDEEVFFTEIEMLSKCKHRNIVTLLGFCDEGSEMILVIEHTSGGYLWDYLENIKEKPILTWARRLKICLDVAHGLKYLHYEMENQKTIINRDISSYNIVLDENLVAKIRFFGYSVFLSPNQDHEVLHLNTFGEMDAYTDPEFQKTGKLKRESDVYSFGFVLFEILFGRSFFDPMYVQEGAKGLASVARRGFHEGTLMEMIDPMIKRGSGDYSFTLNRGPNKNSLDTFIKIAYECLAETQDQRPTMEVVVKELEKALIFQEKNKDDLRISLEDITMATQNFHDDNRIGRGGFGNVYKGKFPKGDGFDTIVAKRLNTSGGQGEQQFRNELQILFEYNHDNIIRLVGYCDEKDEKIIVYEYASKGSLDRYVNSARLTWMKRLKICIDVASALEFLHGGVSTKAAVIHRDIKTENILINDEWKAKLADYGLSLISAVNQETDYVIDRACGTLGYVDPVYLKSGFLTMESDIYSFGVVLFEILCGTSTFAIHKHEGQYLPSFIKQRFEKGNHDEVVFEAIKTQIAPKALNAFQTIAYQCLHDNRENRPTAKEILEQLKKALKFQNESSVRTASILK